MKASSQHAHLCLHVAGQEKLLKNRCKCLEDTSCVRECVSECACVCVCVRGYGGMAFRCEILSSLFYANASITCPRINSLKQRLYVMCVYNHDMCAQPEKIHATRSQQQTEILKKVKFSSRIPQTWNTILAMMNNIILVRREAHRR